MKLRQRLGDIAAYLGIAVLVAGVVLPFVRPDLGRYRWWLAGAGVILVVLSFLARPRELQEALARRNVRYGANTAVMVLLVLGIAGFVEAVSYRHNTRFDLTENKRHSLSPQTIQVLQNLKSEVSAVGFFRSDQPNKRTAEDLLQQYQRYGGDRFSWRMVDPDREPALARRYGVESYGTVVLETKERSEKVTEATEEKLTNALVKLGREGKRVVYVVQGHGEHELDSSERTGFSEAKSALERANYEVKPLALAREGKVPDDAAVVVIAGPRTDLLAPEIDALDGYVKRGGKLLVMANPTIVTGGQDAALRAFVGRYGIELGQDLVIEQNPIGTLLGLGPEVPMIQQYDMHPITRDMAGIGTVFPVTRSVNAARTAPEGVSVQPLARTSPASWGETDRASLQRGQVRPDEQDPRGPLPVAAVATRDKARIVVYGTSNLASNTGIGMMGNRDFFLNTVSWLAEEEDQITIRPKDSEATPVFLNSQQALWVFLIPVVVLPGVVLAGGIFAFVRRRAAR